MKLFPHAALILLIAATGCENAQTISALSALETANKQLTSRLDEAEKTTAQMEQKMGVLESDWKEFEQNFEPEKRQNLKMNIEMVEQMVGQVSKDAESAEGTLRKLRELEAEIVKFRDLCKKHAAESADANQVGQLKDGISKIGREVQALVSKLQRLESDFNFLKMKIR